MSNAIVSSSVVNEAEWSVFEMVHGTNGLHESMLIEARELFTVYKQKNIFLNGSFDNQRWVINDEYSHKGLNFALDASSYEQNYQMLFGFSAKQFMNYCKMFIVFSVGKLVTTTFQALLRDIKRIVHTHPNELMDVQPKLICPSQIQMFFEALPIKKDEVSEFLLEYISTQYTSYTGKRRKLCDFVSYFTFDKIIDQYWKEENDQSEKLFYFPVYLWWKITAIVPTRPREFILTPRDCIKKQGNEWILTLRKNKLKGGNKQIYYNIDKDYDLFFCKIPEELALEIVKYKQLTEIYPANELNGLFRVEPHYDKFQVSVNPYSRYYTYVNLSTALQYFYHDVVNKKYHYRVIIDKNEAVVYDFNKKEIQYIQLGDTRHISMINAIAEGISPDIIMQMAAHDNIEMCNHYYSNMSTFIECRTYAKYLQVLSDGNQYTMGSNFYAPYTENMPYIELENNGKCYSPQMANNDISDCINASGDYGEIGYCTTCPYYRTGDYNFFFTDIDIYRNKIDTNMNLLKDLVEQVRKGKAQEEDIQQEILKFQNNKYLFENSIRKKYETERGV